MSAKLPLAEYAAHGVTLEAPDPSVLADALAAEATLGLQAPGTPGAPPAELALARAKVNELQAELDNWEQVETVTLTMDSDQFKTLLHHLASTLGTQRADGYRARLKSSLTVSVAEAKVMRDICTALPAEAGLKLDMPAPSNFSLALRDRLRRATAALLAMKPPLPVEVPKLVPGEVAQTVQNTPGFATLDPTVKTGAAAQTHAEV